jgi:tRNA-binding EMAP/Myf-like protein
MSTFEVKCYKIESVIQHPNADRLEIIKLENMGYMIISQKGLYKVGDNVLYCATDSVLPEYLLRPGFWDESRGKGMLSGSQGNRVRPKRLRGVFSEGILLRGDGHEDAYNFISNAAKEQKYLIPGHEFAEFLGITKYEPKPENIPQNMRVKALGQFLDLTIKYDFDSIKKAPNAFYEYDIVEYEYLPEGAPAPVKGKKFVADISKPLEVYISEKIHGTLLMTGIASLSARNDKFYKSCVYFSSKGLGARGIVLDHNDENNVYVRALKQADLFEKLSNISEEFLPKENDLEDIPEWLSNYNINNSSLLIFGEVFGPGVQDLGYGIESGQIGYRVFDIAIVKNHEDYIFLELKGLKAFCKDLKLDLAPILFEGPYSPEKLAELADGTETISGKAACIREGVVAKSIHNYLSPITLKYRRHIAKSVSEAYHERKSTNGKELTEFQ